MSDLKPNELLKHHKPEPIDWAEMRRLARSRERPSEWPAGLQAISTEGLALFGIDEENRLYWDGKRLATLTLTRWQKIGAVIVTVSAAVAATAAAVSAVEDWKTIGGRSEPVNAPTAPPR